MPEMPPIRYYTIRLGKFSFRELLRVSKWNPLVMMIIFPAKIGLQLPQLPYAAFRDEWLPVDPERLRKDIYNRIMDRAEVLEDEGFEITAWGKNIFLEKNRRLNCVLLWHPSGKLAAIVMDLIEPTETLTITSISTRFQDGRMMSTNNERRIFDLPEKWEIENRLGENPAQLLKRHKEKLEDNDSPIRLFVRDEGPERNLKFDQELGDYLIDRGILEPLDDATAEELWDAR
jgi:hypothetical protein